MVNFDVTQSRLLLNLLLVSLLTFGLDTMPPDGPYLFYEGDVMVARWADTEARTTGKIVFRPENFHRLPAFPSFRPELVDPHRKFSREMEARFSGVEKIAAISDIHGQYETGRKLLENNGIIDQDQQWIYGTGHLVIVGDIFDRGDQVTEFLWLVHNLQLQAREAGGRVHFLLGNHETMILEGDERYLNGKYRTTSGLTGKFYKELYGKDTYLGRWLRSLPLAVRINNTVFIHGGLSRGMVREFNSLEKINTIYHKHLIDAEDITETVENSTRLGLLHGSEGPLWYRGYFKRGDFDDRDMTFVLKKLGAERIVVGHTSFTSIHGYFDNRLVAVDSSIKFGSVGEILLIENNELYRGTIGGERVPLDNPEK